jgi:hypothetical protein
MGKEREFSDEILMAFADGELEGAEREAVERAIDADPAVAARVATFLETRERVSGAFGKVVSARPPDRLFEAVIGRGMAAGATIVRAEAGVSVPFDKPANENRRESTWRPLAFAASIAAATAGVAGYLAGTVRNDPASALAVLAATPLEIGRILSAPTEGVSTILAGPSTTASITGTFRIRDGRICRAFEVRHPASNTAADAIGCRDGATWRLEAAVPRALTDGAFRPASGSAGVDAILDAAGAGQPLAKAEIEAAAKNGWR